MHRSALAGRVTHEVNLLAKAEAIFSRKFCALYKRGRRFTRIMVARLWLGLWLWLLLGLRLRLWLGLGFHLHPRDQGGRGLRPGSSAAGAFVAGHGAHPALSAA